MYRKGSYAIGDLPHRRAAQARVGEVTRQGADGLRGRRGAEDGGAEGGADPNEGVGTA
ncbi:hypothetical protein [Streptomyces sp. NBC_00582]|uniref:hypothetical protein n=1 Tax=Streptomyces sp. NBC_00582 TaxID=2975783 RepID=UPI002E80D2B3|nr:hypothetical protein [Streptomyces sp. NBC_00582]WUB59891.1 hypothetical protein OG852_05535 [Streptomyces sp. NBC_00582]